MNRDFRKIGYILGILGVSLIVFLYGFRLSYPLEPYYDEVYYVNFIRQLTNLQAYNTSLTIHPPLSHFVDAVFLLLLGDHSWVWRLSALLCGLAVLVLIYLVTKLFFRNTVVAIFAVVLFALNGLSITQARIEMPNAMMLMFSLLSFYFFLCYRLDRVMSKEICILATGICLGLAFATKLPALSWMVMFCLISFNDLRKRSDHALRLEEIFGFFVLLPFLIYFLCHLFIPFLQNHTWSDIWKIQQVNLNYHFHIANTQTHGYSSPWWSWPLMLRPIWYFFKSSHGVVNGIFCVGNPMVLWAFPLGLIFAVWRFLRKEFFPSGKLCRVKLNGLVNGKAVELPFACRSVQLPKGFTKNMDTAADDCSAPEPNPSPSPLPSPSPSSR
ncbi:MAG: phospholipid carrier-dependent glycosyltransferase [Candidatus Omnitrophica bacterium]|nr:phospholipid carrier-dependent glycosyltransferase [Candidatus Omnitrophota bacterium]